MIANIVALGETAKQWNGEGFSIGVNDCFRWGKPTDNLVLVDSLRSIPTRKNIVTKSNPEILWSNMSCWTFHPSFKPLGQTFHWKGRFVPGNLYHSNNSPFIAVTLAYRLGYRTMILWGGRFEHPQNDKERQRNVREGLKRL